MKPKLQAIKGGKEKRLLKARELMMQAVMTGDDSYFDEALEMARHDTRRATLELIQPACADAQDQPLQDEPPSPHQ